MLRDTNTGTQSTGYSKLAAPTAQTANPVQHTAAPALHNKTTAPDWLWSEDRQLKQPGFAEIQALSGRKFTLDAAALSDGSNAMCTDFCSPSDSFLDRTHTGHLWINAPFSNLLAFVQHYLHCKQLAPAQTTACILIPGYLLKPLRSLLTGMRLLKRYSKGAQLFTAPDKNGQRKAMPGIHWPVYVYTDIPVNTVDIAVESTTLHGLHNATVVHDNTDAIPVPDSSITGTDKHLTMLFEGTTVQQRLKLQVLLDTGASANFVSPRVLADLNMQFQPAGAKLRLAGDTEAAILGKVKLKVKLQHFTALVPCFVTELCQDFDLILGNSCLTEHKAVLNFGSNTVCLFRNDKLYKLKGAATETVKSSCHFDEFDSSKHLLNCAQASRLIRNGCDSYLVVLNSLQTETVATGQTAGRADAGQTDVRHPETELSDSIASLQHDYADIFEAPTGLPPDRGIEHVIPLVPGAEAVPQRMYRLAPAELTEVKSQVTDLLGRGLIEPSTSAYGSPILFVKKKTGELRMVVDYRALNKLTVKNRFPLPRVDDLFDKLHGAQYFSSLDAASGFHQILLRPEDRPKTAFRTPFGHYQFKVLPFGLTNAPATFQTVMNRLFNPPQFGRDGKKHTGPVLSDFVCVFIDDILIFSKTAEEHKRHLAIVFELLRKHKLQIKPSKCVWGQTELPYLGFIVGRDGIKPDPKKVEAVSTWPNPTTVTEVQQFLGLTNFFRKFILGYAELVSPLTELTKKTKVWSWSAECEQAFLKLKEALTAAPVLAIPDVAAPLN